MTVHGEDLVARLQHAVGRRPLLDRLHRCGRHDRFRLRVQVRQRDRAAEAAADQHRPEQQKRDQQVDAGPGEDHDDPLPRRLRVVGASGHLRRQRLDLLRIHPGDLHVAPSGNRADHVFGLAALDPSDLRRKEQREALHAHPDGLGHDEVAKLVQHDQGHDPEDCPHPAHAISLAGAPVGTRRMPVWEHQTAMPPARAGGIGHFGITQPAQLPRRRALPRGRPRTATRRP